MVDLGESIWRPQDHGSESEGQAEGAPSPPKKLLPADSELEVHPPDAAPPRKLELAFGSGTYDQRVAGRRPEALKGPQEAVQLHQQHFELGKLGSPSEDLPEGSSGCLTPEVVASSPSGGKLSRKAKLPREGAAAGKLSVNSGPCDHCGRKHSPAWRKGPPQAPRLCNACGTHFAHRKSLEGYLPGMKQRDEERLVKLLRNRSPMPEEQAILMELEPPHSPDSPASRPPADQAVVAQQPQWTSFVSEARAKRESWRDVSRLLQAAVNAAKGSRDEHEQAMATELERVQRLYWENKDAAMILLDELAEVEMLFALNTDSRDEAAERSNGMMASTSEGSPAWHMLLQQASRDSISVARLASLVSAALHAAAADPGVEPQLLARLQAVQDLLAAKPPASSKAAALKLLAEIRPCWGHCQACGKRRLVHHQMQPWESFTCGGANAVMPDRTCDLPQDTLDEWKPPNAKLEPAKAKAVRHTKARKRTLDRTATPSTPELDALARAAEEAAELSANESELSHSKGRRTKRAKLGPVAAESGLEKLPVGWRFETVLIRTAPGISAPESAYVCPTTGARLGTLQDALVAAEVPKARRSAQREAMPVKMEAGTHQDAPEPLGALRPSKAQGSLARRQHHVQAPSVTQAMTLPQAQRPHSRGAKSEVQGTNRDAASTLATLHSFKEWNAAQQKTAHSLADVIRSANAAACQPVLPGQPLHKHSSAPGSTAMGRQFRGSRDLQPWATEPLLRSRSENAMRAPTPTEETDSLRSREPSPEAENVPAKSDGQRREELLGDPAPALVAVVDNNASNDLMRQPGGFVIRMAAENGQDPSRGFTAVPASKADVPTIRIITSNPAQQPAGYVAPIAFPGFSRGFSTVTTAVGLERGPAGVAGEPGAAGQVRGAQATARESSPGASTPQLSPRTDSMRRKRGKRRTPGRRAGTAALPALPDTLGQPGPQPPTLPSTVLLAPAPTMKDLPNEPSLTGLAQALVIEPVAKTPEPRGKSSVPPLFQQAVLTPSPPAATAVVAGLPQPPALIVVPEKSLALGRAISDPQVLRRELDRGIHPMEGIAEEGAASLTMEQQWQLLSLQNSPSSSYAPVRPLGRAISDPASVQMRLAEALGNTTGYLPSGTTLVTWQAVVKLMPRAGVDNLELFSLVAALPVRLASTLPAVIPVSQFKPRSQIFMAAVADKPLLLRLGPVDERQRGAVIQMEELKLAAVAQLDGFDLALIPHINSRNSLHIVGLKMDQTTRLEPDHSLPSSPPPRSSTTTPASMSHPSAEKNGDRNGSNGASQAKQAVAKASAKACSAEPALATTDAAVASRPGVEAATRGGSATM